MDFDDLLQHLVAYTYYFNDQRTKLRILQDTTKAELGLTVWDASLIMAKYFERNLKHVLSGLPCYSTGVQLGIVELGAGTGMLGCVLAHLCMHHWVLSDSSNNRINSETPRVVLTDLGSVIPLLVKNATATTQVDEDEDDGEENADSSLYSLVRRSSESVSPVNIMVHELCWGNAVQSREVLELLNGHADIIVVSDCIYRADLFAPLITTLNALAGPNTIVYLGYEKRDFDSEVDFFSKLGETFTFSHVKSDDMDARWSSPDEIYIFIARKR
jgi:hypothetical protein